MFESIISAETAQAYRETEYRVLGDAPFVMLVDERSPALAVAHKRHHVDCSAYVTGCNPLSQSLNGAANAERHAALGRELNARSLAFVEGVGQHLSNQ
ncbi:DUF3293 domain-containing protein [Hydrogenophaga sp.]|uniref:DUF3293 domain-containing protein n=1 Tax=Hydrogenophaga sp. TaxID=1904254 RepID=UPI00351D0EB0